MKLETIHSEPHNAWTRMRLCLKHVQDWPENRDGPYSLILCLSLLLAIGLIVKIGH